MSNDAPVTAQQGGRLWNLVADIGGTNARFAVQQRDSDQLEYLTVYSVSEYPDFIDAFRQFLCTIAQNGISNDSIQAVCLAVACPVANQRLFHFTNSPWVISHAEIKALLGNVRFEIINDFVAVGYAIQGLDKDDWVEFGGRAASPEKPVVVVGPGTGLGICSVIPLSNGVKVIEGEGGHMDFAPVDETERQIQSYLLKKYAHVSIERLLSGNGLLNIYQALCEMKAMTPVHTGAAMITDAALTSNDSVADEVLRVFFRVLGSTAGNMALIHGAYGGVYIAGGILPRILDLIDYRELRRRFEGKGRVSSYLESIPLRVIHKPHLGLFGALQRINSVN